MAINHPKVQTLLDNRRITGIAEPQYQDTITTADNKIFEVKDIEAIEEGIAVLLIETDIRPDFSFDLRDLGWINRMFFLTGLAGFTQINRMNIKQMNILWNKIRDDCVKK